MKTATKYKGMIFSGESVRGLIAGVKSQTRRIIKPQPYWDTVGYDGWRWECGKHCHNWMDTQDAAKDAHCDHCAPHKPGDVVYVKETWAPLWFDYDYEYGHCDDYSPATSAEVKAYMDRMVGTIDVYPRYGIAYGAEWSPEHPDDRGFKWRSPLMMPQWAARLWLRITSVQAERVQSIGYDGRKAVDVLAEGITREQIEHQAKFFHPDDAPALAYAAAFNAINGKGAWERNDWVWVYGLEKAEKPT